MNEELYNIGDEYGYTIEIIKASTKDIALKKFAKMRGYSSIKEMNSGTKNKGKRNRNGFRKPHLYFAEKVP